ncbi:MAG: hypothetical protein GC162_19380 [Planctomycetes bacterium]|nr:hypothetical protein [Planctomycetota bacterium]
MTRRFCMMLLGLVLAGALGGCEAVAWVAQGVTPTPPPIDVKAEYAALDNQRVAVLVDAKLETLFEHPMAQLEIAQALTTQLAASVPGVQVVDAKQVVEFQQRNIYWNTSTYSDLAKRLNVNRLVLIDISDYRLHEPGNMHLWRGTITGTVSVAATDSDHPNDLAYSTVVTAAYPPDKPMGAVNADERTIRLGMLDLFTRGVVGKFHDHKEERDAK